MDEQPTNRKLQIDFSELELAFENASEMMTYYLDLETGEVVMVTDETRRELEEIYEEHYDEEMGELNLPAVLEELDITNWRKDVLLEADQVEAGYGKRFIAIPTSSSWQGYREMEDFIETVTNERLQNRLESAIRDKGAFRRFKDVLLDYPDERQRWFEFKAERVRARILDWLEEEGIEAEDSEA